jgi:CRP-like cAMP-binding protein
LPHSVGCLKKQEIIKFVIFVEDVLYLLETNRKMIVQKLKKELQNDTDVSYRYYSVLSALNDLELTEREIQLMSFIAVSGSISVPSNREKFCQTYETTGATVNNMVSKLKKRNLLLKKDGKIIVNNLISLDFSNSITLEIKILHGAKA